VETSEKNIFELDEFKPLADEWNVRAEVFRRCEAYCDGTVYNAALNGLAWRRSPREPAVTSAETTGGHSTVGLRIGPDATWEGQLRLERD
jgi:hypothetical protein